MKKSLIRLISITLLSIMLIPNSIAKASVRGTSGTYVVAPTEWRYAGTVVYTRAVEVNDYIVPEKTTVTKTITGEGFTESEARTNAEAKIEAEGVGVSIGHASTTRNGIKYIVSIKISVETTIQVHYKTYQNYNVTYKRYVLGSIADPIDEKWIEQSRIKVGSEYNVRQ